jgi:hypothetical protein
MPGDVTRKTQAITTNLGYDWQPQGAWLTERRGQLASEGDHHANTAEGYSDVSEPVSELTGAGRRMQTPASVFPHASQRVPAPVRVLRPY